MPEPTPQENLKLAEKIQIELTQCREDERKTLEQIFQIFTVAAAILALVYASSTALNSDETTSGHISLVITAAMMCAGFFYVFRLGMLSMFRHHYMKELEQMLTELQPPEAESPDPQQKTFFNWVSISAPFISLNFKRKRTFAGYLFVFFTFAAIISLIVLASAFIYAQLSPFISSTNSLIIIIGFACLLIIIFIASTQRSEVVYQFAKEQARLFLERNKNNNTAKEEAPPKPSFRAKDILYFIYPRPGDIQKSLFIAMGFLLALFLYMTQSPLPFSPRDAFAHLAVIWFVLDFCVYQARYQWNDLRGAIEDMNHPRANDRGRLPAKSLGLPRAVILSTLTAAGKLILAIAVSLASDMAVPLLVASGLVFFLAFFYEWARKAEKPAVTLALVSVGYPLRVFAALCATWQALCYANGTGIPIPLTIPLLVLLGTLSFGETFVSLTWVLEGVHLMRKRMPIKKAHIKAVWEQLPLAYRKAEFPLREKGALRTLWNWTFVPAISLLLAAALAAIGLSWHGILYACLIFGLTLACCYIGRSRILLLLPIGLTAAAESILCLISPPVSTPALAILIILITSLYMLVYIFFRHINYESLTTSPLIALTAGLQSVANLLKPPLRALYKTVLGDATWDAFDQEKKTAKEEKKAKKASKSPKI